ncbi:flagellar export chaperone FliS [candidate division KSB1 bacterium]|nr:flagellar export chaperone FliS [candidate division KSB1 bacterium]
MEYQSQISHYKKVQLSTANPGKLVSMLFARLEKELTNAKEFIIFSKLEDKCNSILLSQEILIELTSSLNFEAGEIANNLQSLYLYMYRELNLINLKNDTEAVDVVIQISKDLNSTWSEMLQKNPEVSKESKSAQINYQNMSIVG